MKKVLCSLLAAALVLPFGSAFAQPHGVGGSRPDVTASSAPVETHPDVTASSIIFRPQVTALGGVGETSIIFSSMQ
jgi:hypothetical protein